MISILSAVSLLLACHTFLILKNQAAPNFINKDIQYTNEKCRIASRATGSINLGNSLRNQNGKELEFNNILSASTNAVFDACEPFLQLNEFWINFYDNVWWKTVQPDTNRLVNVYSYIRAEIQGIYKTIIQIKTKKKYKSKIKQIAVVGPYPVSSNNQPTVHESQFRNAITRLAFVPQGTDHVRILPVLTIPKLEDTFFKADQTSTSSLDYREPDKTIFKMEKVIKRLIATMLRLALERYTLQVAQKIIETQPTLENVLILNPESLWDEALISPYISMDPKNEAGVVDHDTKSVKLASWYRFELGKFFPQTTPIFNKIYDGIVYLKQPPIEHEDGNLIEMLSDLSETDSTSLEHDLSMKEQLHPSHPFEIQLISNSESVSDTNVARTLTDAIAALTNLELTLKPHPPKTSSSSGSHSFRSSSGNSNSLGSSARGISMFGNSFRKGSSASLFSGLKSVLQGKTGVSERETGNGGNNDESHAQRSSGSARDKWKETVGLLKKGLKKPHAPDTNTVKTTYARKSSISNFRPMQFGASTSTSGVESIVPDKEPRPPVASKGPIFDRNQVILNGATRNKRYLSKQQIQQSKLQLQEEEQ